MLASTKLYTAVVVGLRVCVSGVNITQCMIYGMCAHVLQKFADFQRCVGFYFSPRLACVIFTVAVRRFQYDPGAKHRFSSAIT